MLNKRTKSRYAFTLVETLVVVMISAMVVTATLMVYQRVRSATVSIVDTMSQYTLQNEILQKIAEDIDRLAAPGFEATIKFRNRAVRGADNQMVQSGQLILDNKYYGTGDKEQVYEEIVWQTSYDLNEGTMILYRMHTGLNTEDQLLEGNAEDSPNAGLYVPVAAGVTFFDLRTQQGENVLAAWTSDTLPKAVRIGLSFAEPDILEDGQVGVPPEEIVYRTVAIDRTRLIPYKFIKVDLDLGVLDEDTDDDPNSVSAANDEMADAADDEIEDDETDIESEDR